MEAKDVKVDLREMKKFKEQNARERLEFIRFWVNYMKTHPDKEWSSQQKELIDDVESRLTQNGYSLGTRVKVGDEWTPQTPGKAVFVPDPTKETGTRTIAQVTNRGLYRDGRVVSPPTYVVKVGTRPVETTNINGNETRITRIHQKDGSCSE